MESALHGDEPAPDGAPIDMLLAELGALTDRVQLDLALVAEIVEDRLEIRAMAGPLARLAPGSMSVRLADCPAEKAVIEASRPATFRHASDSLDPLSGVVLPGAREHVTAPLFVGTRCTGALTLVRVGGEAFREVEVEAVAVHARVVALLLHASALTAEIERLRSHGDERVSLLETELRGPANGVIGSSASPAMREVAWRARQVAQTDTPVLILGETGAGKEWLAHAIHGWSARARGPFVKMNCAAIAAGTLDSELFGHEKGAFTGATRVRPGRFQIADGGTLLLDEIGELPLEVQAKLLRVLQDGTFFPVGSDRMAQVDVRILAATHVDLERAIALRTFRDDLFYRLSVFPLRLPPLRERLEDLPMLCEVLLAQQVSRTGRRRVAVTPAGLEKLARHTWPGNLRELGNVLERATILSRGEGLGPEVLDLPERATPSSGSGPPPSTGAGHGASAGAPSTTLDDAQRRHIEHVLTLTNGKVYGEGGAAKILGIKPSTLQSRMQKLGLRRVSTDRGRGDR